jgi:uncharacterized membrane protein (UPF0127 family)
MKKIVTTIICILILFVGQISICLARKIAPNGNDYIEFKNKKVFVSIAKTDEELAKGLMDVDKIQENHGMAFLFKEPDYKNFWMKNMIIPIDMVFIYKNKIGTIYRKVPPCKKHFCPIYQSKQKVDTVVEVNAGFCDKYKINEGDSIKFSNTVLNVQNKLRSGK